MKNALCQKRVLELALKGIRAEIKDEQRTIEKGSLLIKALDNREPIPSKLSRYEIEQIIIKARKRVNELLEEEHEIEWELATLDIE